MFFSDMVCLFEGTTAEATHHLDFKNRSPYELSLPFSYLGTGSVPRSINRCNYIYINIYYIFLKNATVRLGPSLLQKYAKSPRFL